MEPAPVVECPMPPDCDVACVPFSETECGISPLAACDDDSATILAALFSLPAGYTIRLFNDFVFYSTMYVPSNVHCLLQGTVSLGDNADNNLARIGYVNATENIDARRLTGITEAHGGAINITMEGGLYDFKLSLP